MNKKKLAQKGIANFLSKCSCFNEHLVIKLKQNL